jgi:hypothetical protein
MAIRSLTGVVLALTLAGLSSVHAESLTAEEAEQALLGKHVDISCADGTKANGHYGRGKNSGIITGTYQKSGKPPVKEVAVTRLDGSRLCMRFQDDDDESCFGVTRNSPSNFKFTKFGGLFNACDVNAMTAAK